MVKKGKKPRAHAHDHTHGPRAAAVAEPEQVARKRREAAAGPAVEEPSKRAAGQGRQKLTAAGQDDLLGEELEFEDPYGDEFEEEEELDEEEAGAEGDEDEEMGGAAAAAATAAADEAGPKKPQAKVWRPDAAGTNPEELDWDPRAYTAYHRLRLDWPCLSFDVLRDHLGEFRNKFPVTTYLACGTQADRGDRNLVRVLKLSELHRTKRDRGEDDSDSSSEEGGDDDDDDADNNDDLDDDPILEERSFRHPGGVNRLRSMPQNPSLLATMADTGKVHVWNVLDLLQGLDIPGAAQPGLSPNRQPVFTFGGHKEEGFAVDWSPVEAGRMVTGDCDRNVHLWNPAEASWVVDASPFRGHTGSVEDLQWSPSQPNVFASCSVDRTIRVWDTRVKEKSQLFVAAHKQDVNVISWNHRTSYLLCSGSDDGSFKIWDLRPGRFKSDSYAANFKWHRGPITSIEWHPVEESVLAASSADNSTTVWDLALESDDGPAQGAQLDPSADLPPQLLFEHLGQRDVKELHWHPQIPSLLVTTASDGIDLFKPSNMEEELQPQVGAVPPPPSSSAMATE